MLDCCRSHADEYLHLNAPFEGYDTPLCDLLISLLRKWGPIITGYQNLIVLRCSTSQTIGINAKTYTLACPSCDKGAPVVIIGSKLLYFVWRLSMVCATYFTSSEEVDSERVGLVGHDDWPKEEHLEQVRTAYKMYFTDAWLSDEGLVALNQQIAAMRHEAYGIHEWIVDMAELFVLMHEIQHQLPLHATSGGEIGMSIQFEHPVEISPERAGRWREELNNDANAAWLMFVSTASKLKEFGLDNDAARIQSASIVFAGIDIALHTLQLLEEDKYGKFALRDAAYARQYVKHPPSSYRRDVFSNVAFSLFTGHPSEELYAGLIPPAWQSIANNIVSHMKVMDRLVAAYRERYPLPITGKK